MDVTVYSWSGNADGNRDGSDNGNANGNATECVVQINKLYFSISFIFQKQTLFSKNRLYFPEIDSIFQK